MPPADPDLPLQIWGRDGSFMTPWGMIIGQMAQWWRRGEYGPVLDFCFENNVPIYDKVTAGAYEGGDFMIVKPGHLLDCIVSLRSPAANSVGKLPSVTFRIKTDCHSCPFAECTVERIR